MSLHSKYNILLRKFANVLFMWNSLSNVVMQKQLPPGILHNFWSKRGFRQAPRVEPVSSPATFLKPLHNRYFPDNSQDLL